MLTAAVRERGWARRAERALRCRELETQVGVTRAEFRKRLSAVDTAEDIVRDTRRQQLMLELKRMQTSLRTMVQRMRQSSDEVVRTSAEYFRQLRETVRSDYEIAFDAHAKIYEPTQAMQLGNALAHQRVIGLGGREAVAVFGNRPLHAGGQGHQVVEQLLVRG